MIWSAQQRHRSGEALVEVVDQAAIADSTGLFIARAHHGPSGGRWRSSMSASRALRIDQADYIESMTRIVEAEPDLEEEMAKRPAR